MTMKLPMAYFLALPLFLSITVAADNFCSNEVFPEEGFPNSSSCRPYTKDANLTELIEEHPLTLVESSDTKENFFDNKRDFLFCCFHAQPFCPKIRWFKDGKELNSRNGDGKFEINDGGRVLNIATDAHSVGNYTCKATTPYGGVKSVTIELHVTFKCIGNTHITTIPKTEETIKVLRGASKNLTCEYFCLGEKTFDVSRWTNGEDVTIYPDDLNFITSATERTFGGNPNGPDRVHTLTIVNFTKSEHFTCILSQNLKEKPVKHTFRLILKECMGTPTIKPIPGGLDQIRTTKGSNVTLTCQIYCLEKHNFGNFTWRLGSGDYITKNSLKYQLTRKEIPTSVSSDGKPNYEISLTIKNILRNEIFTCNHSSSSKGSTLSHAFRLFVEPVLGSITGEESFFKQTGKWIVIGVLLAFITFLGVLLFCYRRTFKKFIPIWAIHRISEPDKNAQYDAFISYSEDDGGSFVRSTLVPMLEDQCGYTLSLHYREFILGTPIVDNIIEFLSTSRKILMVVTPEFLESHWCMFEVEQGLRRAVFKPNTLVVIMLNEIPLSELPVSLQKFVSSTTYLVWNDSKLDKMRTKLKRTLGLPLTVTNQGGATNEETMEQESEESGISTV